MRRRLRARASDWRCGFMHARTKASVWPPEAMLLLLPFHLWEDPIWQFPTLCTPLLPPSPSRPSTLHALHAAPHFRFAVAEGDLIAYLNVWRAWEQSGRSKKWAVAHRVMHRSMLRAADIREQVRAGAAGAAYQAGSQKGLQCGERVLPLPIRAQQEGYASAAAPFIRRARPSCARAPAPPPPPHPPAPTHTHTAAASAFAAAGPAAGICAGGHQPAGPRRGADHG